MPLPLLFLHAPATAAEAISHLGQHHPELLPPRHHLIQHSVPKVDAADLSPAYAAPASLPARGHPAPRRRCAPALLPRTPRAASHPPPRYHRRWPADPPLEWSAAGDGALFSALADSGLLESLLSQECRYMLVADAENLAATLDLQLLSWFAASGAPMALEVCDATPSDAIGCGVLASDAAHDGGGGLLLRHPLQAPVGPHGQPASRFEARHVSTNSLWLDLRALRAALDAAGGALPLPPLTRRCTIYEASPSGGGVARVLPVAHLETAAATAVGCLDGAQALAVPRSRFSPLRDAETFLALASDAYETTADHRRVLRAERRGVPPLVRLDPLYASYGALMTLVPNGVPSLRTCTSLRVEGLVVFGRDVCITGDVAIVNPHGASRTLRAGWYRNQTVTFAPEKPATPKERGGLERKFGAHVKEQGGGAVGGDRGEAAT